MKEKYIVCPIEQYEKVNQAVSYFVGYDIQKIAQYNGLYLVPISVELQLKIPDILDGFDGFEIIDDI
jgi:hypothetical protein